MAAGDARGRRAFRGGNVTALVLVRHGQTEWHEDNRYAGVSDVALTAAGIEQAGQLAAWSRSAGLAAIWCSTLTRAQLTAQACAEATGVPLVVDERLRELDFGLAEGMTVGDMEVRFPQALRAFRADPVLDHLPGGEDPVAAAERFAGCLADACRAHPDGRVLVVAHTTVIRLALCSLIGVPLREYRRLFPAVHNCALTELLHVDGRTAVLEFNTPVQRLAAAPPVPLTPHRTLEETA